MRKIFIAAAAGLFVAAGLLSIRAQDPLAPIETPSGRNRDAFQVTRVSSQTVNGAVSSMSDADCSFFGPDRARFVESLRPRHAASHLTEDVVARLTPLAVASLPSAPGGSRTDTMQNPSVSVVDREIFQAMAAANVAPAPSTTDYEFVRRVTLDLTGRIPTPAAVTAFVNDAAPDKRSKLIDQLLTAPEWLDKWTVWFADLYNNNSTNTLAANRYLPGVMAFNQFIRTSLQNSVPYNQMASQMIAGTGTNSYLQGELNFLVGGVMGGGPTQDVFDQQTATTFETFLGLAHVNCLLCHNGRGHLDALSLWGYQTTRTQAWGLASFMSHTASVRVPVSSANNQPYYWSFQNDINATYRTDYRLNTQTGNRPARGATNSTVTVKPAYLNGNAPLAGENYRAALARNITGDFQFARATVNYLWEYFMGIGLVSPSNQFDLARLDPDNPPANCPLPTNPCTLQASHPRLLNQLAQDFVNSNYNVKAVMREIVTSRAYQLSSRYTGTWNSANERLFARKLVRRLWSEEIHDGIVQSFASSVPPVYNNATWGPLTWAMQLPEPLNTPGGTTTTFLNAFLRGNRDDQARKGDPSISQALSLMNDPFVMTRVTATKSTDNNILTQALKQTDTQMVQTLFMAVLSRPPADTELALALNNLKGLSTSARTTEAQTLLWSLYNKVDFMYNY
ncbi:MAG: DUF1549 domain-containing protein [Acidobacteriota bacterium]